LIQWDDSARCVDLAVRDLLPHGGASPGGVAGLAPAVLRARWGSEQHGRWQAERLREDSSFEREVNVRHRVVVRDWTCTITGRIDGLCWEGGRQVVEELKTSILDADQLEALGPGDFPAWCEQLRLYLYFLELEAEGHDVTGRLVVVSLADGWRRVLHLPPDPEVAARLHARLDWIVAARDELAAHRQRRRGSPVPFAHQEFRPGQEQMSRITEQALTEELPLLVSAPTGVGKTAAVLQGALRRAYACDARVFVATARTTQQQLAIETLAAMRSRGLVLRALLLRAKAKSCLHHELDCHPERCPYAAELEEKLRQPSLLERLLADGIVLPEAIAELGRAIVACPARIAAELVDRCDVVVGDYNYVFDPDVALRRHFGPGAGGGDGAGSWIVLVDEGHNLPPRARSWLSPAMGGQQLGLALEWLQRLGPGFQDHLAALEALLEAIHDADPGPGAAFPDGTRVTVADQETLGGLARRFESLALDYAVAFQARWRRSAGQLDSLEAGMDPYVSTVRGLQRFVARLAEAGEETVVLYRPAAGREVPVLQLFCRDPAGALAARIDRLAGFVAFSATLEPFELQLRLLGLRADRSRCLRVDSPFHAEQLGLVLADRVSTRFKHRERDRVRTAEILERLVASIPGNAALLFPSFAMRDDLVALLELPGRERLLQLPQMDEQQRAHLLDLMRDATGLPKVLLGVLGGIFAEGVDLPGSALLAVVVVGPGLPAVGPEQELVRGWFQERWGQGFRHAYLLPGLTRVVQAAGRVIRSPDDRGVVVLVGQRFLQREVQAFFPADWEPQRSARPWEDVERFFHRAQQDAELDLASSV